MRYENVPDIDARYWVAMTIASVLGCNAGDCLSFYAGWNHWIGLLPALLLFGALLFGERHSKHQNQFWYWAVVITLRAAATNLADLATHTFEWPYSAVLLGLGSVQLLVVWPILPRLRASITDAGRPATTAWYWASLLTAGTLGTVIGDWAAEELHLGTGHATILLAALFVVALASGNRTRWTTKVGYWLSIVGVRSAGTTAGDWLAFRDDPGFKNGLNLGLPLSTALTGILLIGFLFWTGWYRNKGAKAFQVRPTV